MGCFFCCCNNDKNNKKKKRKRREKDSKEKLSFGTAVEEIRSSARSIIGSPLSTKINQGDITSWVKPQMSGNIFDDDDEYEETFWDKIPIIHPFGPFRLIWDTIVIFLLLYTAIEVPCK